jgi:hypothetical protein
LTINAYLLTPDGKNYSNHKADFGFLKEIFTKKKIEIIEAETLPECDRAFVVIPGYDTIGKTKTVSKELAKTKRVVLFVTSDECGLFDPKYIAHPNIEIWVQSPFPKHEAYHKYPFGAPTMLKENLPEYADKVYDVFFSGQITHERRQELAEVMPSIENGLYNPTAGFMQGYDSKQYYEMLMQSRIAPAPAGNVTIDSFRFYEALETLCIPIGDGKSSAGEKFNYYNYVFNGDIPVEITTDWYELPKIKEKLLSNYPENLHQVVAWWIKYKRDFAVKIMEQVYEH